MGAPAALLRYMTHKSLISPSIWIALTDLLDSELRELSISIFSKYKTIKDIIVLVNSTPRSYTCKKSGEASQIQYNISYVLALLTWILRRYWKNTYEIWGGSIQNSGEKWGRLRNQCIYIWISMCFKNIFWISLESIYNTSSLKEWHTLNRVCHSFMCHLAMCKCNFVEEN